MRNSYKLRPRLEGMESRALLSGAAGAVGAIVSPPILVVIPLNGTVKGNYNAHHRNPDLPKVYNLFGAGDVGLKARTALAGTIEEGSFSTNPDAHGTVFLANDHGTLTMRLTADSNSGMTGGLPDTFDYTIVGGTGRYQHATGKGTAVLTLDVNKPPATTTTAHGEITQHGTFDLVFVSSTTTPSTTS